MAPRQSGQETSLAKRLASLENKTIGFVSNGAGTRGESMFPMIQKELAKRYPSIEFVDHRAFGITHGGWEGEA